MYVDPELAEARERIKKLEGVVAEVFRYSSEDVQLHRAESQLREIQKIVAEVIEDFCCRACKKIVSLTQTALSNCPHCNGGWYEKRA